MKPTQLAAAIILLGSLAGCSPDSRSPAERVFEKAQISVVKVYSLLEQGQPGRSGTGFVVVLNNQPSQILTNKHLTENASVVVVESPTDIWVAEKWSEHPSLDAALLEIPQHKKLIPLQSGSASQAKPGQPIFVVGYPLGDNISIQPGHISALGMGELVFNAPFSQGASGSPLLDINGQVIGLCHSYMREAQNHNLATPLDLLGTAEGTWLVKTGTPDAEVQAYLEKIAAVKKVLHSHLEEWTKIAQDMPDWYTWVGRSMLTRKPLAGALENVFLAVHSIQWSQLRDPSSRIINQFESELLGQKAKALGDTWNSHRLNLQHLVQLKPQPLPDMEIYEMQQLVESTKNLSKQLRVFLSQSDDQSGPDFKPLTCALQQYLEHEDKCFALGLP